MPDEQKPKSLTLAETFGLTTYAFIVMSACFTPVLHSRFGRDGLGPRAAIAGVVILVWGAESHSYLMLHYLALWLVMVIYRRIETWWTHRKGHIVHSYFTGFPPLYRWLGEKARTLEIALLFIVGLCLTDYDLGASRFLISGAVAMGYLQTIGQMIAERNARNRDNAVIEASMYR